MAKLTLSIDAAISDGSFSLWDGTHRVSSALGSEEISLSGSILTTISEILDESGHILSDIGQIVCTTGPGSYTGLRVGISTVIGLSKSLNCDTVPVPVFNAYVIVAEDFDRVICANVIGRDEIIFQEFARSDGNPHRNSAIMIKTASEFREYVEQRTILCLVGDKKFHSLLESMSWDSSTDSKIINASDNVSVLAYKAFQRNQSNFVYGEMVPIYGREFGVKRK